MTRVLCSLLALAAAAAAFAADPNESRILPFMAKAMDQLPGDLSLEAKESGPGFAVYFVKRTAPDGKKTDQQTIIYQPGQKKIIIGDYFNLARFKDKAIDPDFLGSFLSSSLGTTIKVTTVEVKPDGTRLTVHQETGYGKVDMPAFLFGRFHFIMGNPFDVEGDPAAQRLRAIRWDRGAVLGPDDAPNTLAIFLDMECPHCAFLERQILPLVRDRKDLRVGFFQFPLTIGHPLAFKAAAAAHCFGAHGGATAVEFMEYFYPLRKDIDFSSVDLTNYGFAELKGLEEPFLACYMKEPNIRSVLNAMQMAVDVGVAHTPMIYYNGLSYYPNDILALLKPEAPPGVPAAEPADPPSEPAP